MDKKESEIYELLQNYKDAIDKYLQKKKQLAFLYWFYNSWGSKYAKTILKQIDQLDKKALTLKRRTGVPVLDLLMYYYVKAVVENSNSFRYTNTNTERNKKMIQLFNKIIKDRDIDLDVESNFKITQQNNIKIYSVKDIPVFWEQPIKCKHNVYYCATVRVAQNILQMGKLLPANRLGLYVAGDIFFNTDKIFFMQNLKETIDYAKKWSLGVQKIIFECDVSQYDIYLRKHLIINRVSELLFINATELPITNILKNIYIVNSNGDKKQITAEQVLEIESLVYYGDRYEYINLQNTNDNDNTCNSIDQHLNFLNKYNFAKVYKKNEKYYVWRKNMLQWIIYPIKVNGVLYHGTGIPALQNILKTKKIMWGFIVKLNATPKK